MSTAAPLPATLLLRYGLFALPLAMVALPLYVAVPQFYAMHCGLPLALIGAVLLLARLLAAFSDPLLGCWITQGRFGFARIIGLSLPLLAGGFYGLFHPPQGHDGATVLWLLANLLLLYLGFGLAMIAHQSWGAALGSSVQTRTSVAGAREGCALLGVLLAAGLSGVAGQDGLNTAFLLLLALAAYLLLQSAALRRLTPLASRQAPGAPTHWRHALAGLWLPLRQPRFRALFLILLVNGVAGAIPATLFLFFVADRLQLASLAGRFLMLYFAAAACSMPLWQRLALRLGEARAWGGAMLAASAAFVWAFALAPQAAGGFAVVCLFSGLTMGADLALPAALLTAVIAEAGHENRHEAAYFGLWNWGVQMNLALAAGIVLPGLAAFGYQPGNAQATTVLAAAYALLPCLLKLLAALLLWRAPLHCWPHSAPATLTKPPS